MSFRFENAHLPTKLGQLVVATPLRLLFRRLLAFGDEPIQEHALDGAVERPRSQGRPRASDPLDLAHDRIAVADAASDGEQDQERGRGQREQVFRISMRLSHPTRIYPSWTVQSSEKWRRPHDANQDWEQVRGPRPLAEDSNPASDN